jgi:hypothetical protein
VIMTFKGLTQHFFLVILEKIGEIWNFWGFLVARLWPKNEQAVSLQ